MSGALFLPGGQPQSLWTYTHIGADGWHAWKKPAGATFITIIGVGGPGGGGGGNTAVAGNTRGGGGGGGSGAVSRLVIPAAFVPDVLYIRPGAGGAGGAATVAGSVGTVTMVATSPFNQAGGMTTTAYPALLYLVANNGSGANPGSSNGAGAAGGAASTGAECMFSGWGEFTSTQGGNGTAGGSSAGAVGVTLTYGSLGIPFSGGTGGGGVGVANTDFAGGPITGVGLLPQHPGGIAAAGPGNGGLALGPPPFYCGGTGGGTAGASGTAGRGGDGAWGCGGGGGGGGVTGGAGGYGGSGAVWIVVSF